MQMIRTIILSCLSFIYTLLYVFVLDRDLIIFPLLNKKSEHTQSGVSNIQMMEMQILFFIILTIIMIILVVLFFASIRTNFIFIYASSLLASLLMPLFFNSLNSGGFIGFPWVFTGIRIAITNLLLGPAMFFLISYFILKRIKG